MSPLVDTPLLTIYAPWTRGAAFLGLEAVVLVAGALGLIHALGARRRGDPTFAFTWGAIFVYGVALELIAYNAFPNFTHGQFTVMLYHRKLPLYVTFVYPVMLYTGFAAVRRLGLSAWAQPIVTGLAIVALDAPFDILGPPAGFWRWDPADPNVAYRWLGVPVTSFYWHLTWGAILCALCRVVAPRVARAALPLQWVAMLGTAAATLALGRIAFLPFDALVPLGVSQGLIVATALAGAAAVLALSRKRPAALEPLIGIAAGLFAGFHAALAAALFYF